MEQLDEIALLKGYKMWESKATRRMWPKFGIYPNELEALSIVWGYQVKRGKIDKGTGKEIIIGHSGYSRLWKIRIDRGIEACIVKGFLDRVPFARGYRIQITQKGSYVLGSWVEELKNQMNYEARIRKSKHN